MIKKPLVLTDGEIEQIQSGDSLLPAPNSLTLSNGSSIDLPICGPVCISAADTAEVANAETLPNAIGLVGEPILMGENGAVQTDGKITATTAEWDAVTGQTGGLTPGSVYYLGAIGGLTVTPVITGYLTRLGIAVNSTDLEIKISRPIRL